MFLNEEMCGYLSVLLPLVLKQFESGRLAVIAAL